MNKLLQRQIKKYLGDAIVTPGNIENLLKVISDSYDHHEKDRKMLERSIELSSKEMVELNAKIKKETEESSKVVYESLKESLAILNDTKEENTPNELDLHKLSQIANILKEETKKRRTAERERTQRAAHLEASQKIAHIGSWEIDIANFSNLNINPLYWSDETYRIFGYEPRSIAVTNEIFFNHVYPDDKPLIERAIRKSLETGEVYDIEHRILLDNGIEKIVHERADIIFDKKTQGPVKMIGTVQDITEQKKTEAQLRKVNYELSTLFENMQECAYTVDMTTYQLIQISPSCEEVYGHGVEEFMNNSNLWIEVVVEEDKQNIWAKNANLERGESIENIYRIHHGKGGIRWLESKLKPTLNNEGKLIRLDGITADITKRVAAEQRVKENEQRFRSLIENSSDGILLADETGTVFYASDSVYHITGDKPEEMVGAKNIDFMHPDDVAHSKHFLQDLLNNPGETKTIQYRRRKKDGNYIWIESTVTNLLNDPAVKGIVGNFRNITERIEAEEALKENEYRFRSLIENSSDATVVINENFEISFATNSLFRITGFLPEEVVGHANSDFVHPDDKETAEDFLRDILANPGKAKTIVYRLYKKNGELIWTERVATNLIDDPVIKGIVINFKDITERVAYEDALKISNEELKKSNNELDKFVYSVSHDLRAPLSSMLGILGLIESETTDTNILEDLQLLKTSINKLDGFIMDILDYSRNARLEINSEPIHFDKLLDDIKKHLKHMASANSHVDIRIHIENGIPFYSDSNRLNIIFNNLISNSLRYSNPDIPDPYVEIDVKIFEDKSIIKVKDNGIGISKENQGKVFDMFYRVSKKSVGSGLGLYIVKEIVERLHGSIHLESEPEKGTEFIITLPNMKNKTIH